MRGEGGKMKWWGVSFHLDAKHVRKMIVHGIGKRSSGYHSTCPLIKLRRNEVKTIGTRILSLTLLFVMLATGVFGCAAPKAAPATAAPATAAPAAEPKTLLIGDIETLTGASSDNLKLAASGSYLAQQYVNKHGGITINGEVYMVKIKLEDNKGTADGAQAAVTKLDPGRPRHVRHRQWSPASDQPPLVPCLSRLACCMHPFTTMAPKLSRTRTGSLPS